MNRLNPVRFCHAWLFETTLQRNPSLQKQKSRSLRLHREREIERSSSKSIGDSVLDASGLHVLPGVVDAHVHFNEPGRTDWEGFLTGSTAAAAGGVTTVCDMPLNCHPPTLDARALAIKRGPVADHALIDYAFWGGLVPESLEHAAELNAKA